MEVPEDLRYTKEHEWARLDAKGKVVTIGITDYAQEKLGDVVFVELPEEGDEIRRSEPFGSIESVKAVSEVFCPVAGEVVEINQELVASPQWVNEDPYGDAWFIKLKISSPEELKELFSAGEYEQYVAEESAE